MTSDALDILYIVLSIGVVWVVVFLCWALYECASLLRKGNQIVERATERVTKIENALVSFKEKFGLSSQVFGVGIAAAKTFMHFVSGAKKKK